MVAELFYTAFLFLSFMSKRPEDDGGLRSQALLRQYSDHHSLMNSTIHQLRESNSEEKALQKAHLSVALKQLSQHSKG